MHDLASVPTRQRREDGVQVIGVLLPIVHNNVNCRQVGRNSSTQRRRAGAPHRSARCRDAACRLARLGFLQEVATVQDADVRRAYERTRAGLDAETFDATHLSGKKLNLTQLLDLARASGAIGASPGGEPVEDRSRSDESPPTDVERNHPVSETSPHRMA